MCENRKVTKLKASQEVDSSTQPAPSFFHFLKKPQSQYHQNRNTIQPTNPVRLQPVPVETAREQHHLLAQGGTSSYASCSVCDLCLGYLILLSSLSFCCRGVRWSPTPFPSDPILGRTHLCIKLGSWPRLFQNLLGLTKF
jgi:hypothetical protein